ncbi:hypothetical protein BJ878DRAFT_569838 [Calycina marina]|uniref:Uncharacterized protein n=1 Tax=Calycina marina TaxID=1763456 RepID=A0A9P7YYN7_9HELO|nr:hypothetical protein BJ878DRAFT_569838 [Calycina marina]
MHFQQSTILLSLAAASQALSIRHLDLAPNKVALARRAESTCLSSSVVQDASTLTGQETPADGQVDSATDSANFINFCDGQTITNGLQVEAGSCNGIVMGNIPSTSNMISSIIVSPEPAEDIDEDTDFTISVQTSGLDAGSFTNAASTYYSAPQDLSSSGEIIGHTHVTVQDMGSSLVPTTPLDPTTFVFFKGINDDGDGNGLLSATVTGGLPAGNYRVCTMTAAANHQPVLMPIAQRGAQDDCQKFTVGAGSSSSSTTADSSDDEDDAATSTEAADATTSAEATETADATTSAEATETADATTSAEATETATATTSAETSSSTSSSDIGGIAAAEVTDSGDDDRPFEVNGQTFATESAAKQRACDIQNNACANAVNSGTVSGFTVTDCNTQQAACSKS